MKDAININLQSIVEISRINGTKAYDTNKEFANINEGKEMIRFCSKTVCVRKINDWVTDENSDIYIGLSKDGWIKYTHDLQNGCGLIQYTNDLQNSCGVIKANNWDTCLLSDTDIINFLKSNECTDEEYLMFMSKAYTFYK